MPALHTCLLSSMKQVWARQNPNQEKNTLLCSLLRCWTKRPFVQGWNWPLSSGEYLVASRQQQVSIPALLRVNMVLQLGVRARLLKAISYTSNLFWAKLEPSGGPSARQPGQRNCLGSLLYWVEALLEKAADPRKRMYPWCCCSILNPYWGEKCQNNLVCFIGNLRCKVFYFWNF